MIVTVLLFSVFFYVIQYMYKKTEETAFHELHMQTLTIKENINLQITSDMENLATMANFAAKLYSDGESFNLLFDSYESIGVIEKIGILMPDDSFITKSGRNENNDVVKFKDVVKKRMHISGRVDALNGSGESVVRCYVPIEVDNKTVAMFYGVIDLEKLRLKYEPLVSGNNAELFVFECENGDILIDTLNESLGNISIVAERVHKKGFTYSQMRDNIYKGVSGYTAYISPKINKTLYAHYAPLNIEGWEIMLAQPEDIVFKDVMNTAKTMYNMLVIMLLIILVYLFGIFATERKQSNLNLVASKIRKRLLEINQRTESIMESLRSITSFGRARSAFFIDTLGEDVSYINPSYKDHILSEEDRKQFAEKITDYTRNMLRDNNIQLSMFNINIKDEFRNDYREDYEFFEKHKISRLCFSAVAGKDGTISLLGAINPRRYVTLNKLLKDISVCFSMAVGNRNHLIKTEYVAVTDSLTGVSNRQAYKKDTENLRNANVTLACIYIDVNELHVVNNRYGHSAGDAMLVYVARKLKEIFGENYVYRMGGDEFLVFVKNFNKNDVLRNINKFDLEIEKKEYHVSVGVAFKDDNTEDIYDIEDLVKHAEELMYDEKAKYYQNKEMKSIAATKGYSVKHISTGVPVIDSTLSVMTNHYYAIYGVNLETDEVRRVIMPSYFEQLSEDDCFSKSFKKYIDEFVTSDCRRALLGFLQYDVLKRELESGKVPTITYERTDGNFVKLSIYVSDENNDNHSETIWVFEK